MNSTRFHKKGGNTPVVLLSFLLFYCPSAFSIFARGSEPRGWIMMSVVMATIYSLIFCINYFWLVPAMLVRTERKAVYFLVNLCLIMSLCSSIPLMMIDHEGPRHLARHIHNEPSLGRFVMGYIRFMIRDGVMMVLSAALAYALRLSSERENVRRRQLELNAEQRQIELRNLKAQLNPHFLFNSLNNIYALIGFAPEKAQEALHDLSGMLRFMIYDSASQFVTLDKETRFIADYVELIKLRLNPSVNLVCNLHTASAGNLSVAPLLFLTLVENAFKHSSHNGISHFIQIDIFLTDKELVCNVRNSIGSATDESSGKTDNHSAAVEKESGVGLENVKRQLGLLYPGEHTLSLNKGDGVFDARISISTKALQASQQKENDNGQTSEMHHNR